MTYQRPEILDKLFRENRDWYNAYVGLFNGGQRRGRVWPNGSISLGKCECEPSDWRECYAYMQKLGIVEFKTVFEDHPRGRFEYIELEVTKHGWDVREEDMRRWRAASEEGEE